MGLFRLSSVCGCFTSFLGATSRRLSAKCPSCNSKEARKKIVWLSDSSDIYSNLALEDWIYRNKAFDNEHLLLIWRNDPCIVIGRHQNPWTECNVPYLRERAIMLARRNSGGGTVFHDQGNINCTFFTSKKDYNRRRNLDLICLAIKRLNKALNVQVNEREDIVLESSYKISGTAAKLGKDNAYHHCTILVNVGKSDLHEALASQAQGVDTRATQSVRVPVKNLCDVEPSITVEALQEAVSSEFLSPQNGPNVDNETGVKTVRPNDQMAFPGLLDLREELCSDSWIWRKTPRFSVRKTFEVPEHLESSIATADPLKADVEIKVDRGVVQSAQMELPFTIREPSVDNIGSALIGKPFGPDLTNTRITALDNNVSPEKKYFFKQCLFSMLKHWT